MSDETSIPLESPSSPTASQNRKTAGGGAGRGLGGLLDMLRNSSSSPTTVLEISPQSTIPAEGGDITEVMDGLLSSVVSSLETTTIREERRQRKAASGVAALLQQLRGGASCDASDSSPSISSDQPSAPPPSDTLDLSKLNRKERRALLQKQQREAGGEAQPENTDEAEVPVKMARFEVPFNLWNVVPQCAFVESAAFSGSLTQQFGFAASQFANNYVKLVKFSPCGQYLASTSQDRKARVFRFDHANTRLDMTSSISLGDLPYDAVWHPCGDLLATSAKHHPIHLWNTEGGREATYRGINHLDELAAAQTMAFSRDGLRLYAGYDKCIRIWDVRRPGKQMQDIKTWRTKPYNEGQKSIVSCIAMHPVHEGVYAVGTYGPTIGLYSDRTNFVECMFGGDFTAVTDLKYSPDGLRLYSCGRKSGSIECWDMRYTNKAAFTLKRPFDTNQRVYFDVDGAERFLFSGTSDGEIVVFDLQSGDIVRGPRHSVQAAKCSIPCVSSHPCVPVVAACTGERVFPYPKMMDDTEEEKAETDETTTRGQYLDTNNQENLENCIQLWKY